MTESQRHEQSIANALQSLYPNARVQPGSGNLATHPNDIRVPKRFHVECKCTSASQMTIHHSWLLRVIDKALQFGVRGVLAIRMKAPMANGKQDRDYFVVPAQDFYHLLACELECER